MCSSSGPTYSGPFYPGRMVSGVRTSEKIGLHLFHKFHFTEGPHPTGGENWSVLYFYVPSLKKVGDLVDFGVEGSL